MTKKQKSFFPLAICFASAVLFELIFIYLSCTEFSFLSFFFLEFNKTFTAHRSAALFSFIRVALISGLAGWFRGAIISFLALSYKLFFLFFFCPLKESFKNFFSE